MQFLRWLYASLLSLFPRAYREEYGDELRAVFNSSLNDAEKLGWMEVVRVTLRELISVPGVILYEHLRERRRTKMTGKFASRFDFAPGTRKEILAATAPLILFGVLPFVLSIWDNAFAIPIGLRIAGRLLLVFSVLSLFLIGLGKGMPRWSLPYLGLPLPIVSILLFNFLPEFPALFNRLYDISWFSGAFVFGGLTLMGVLFSIILLVFITRIVPKLYPFHQRLREDWTLLCFLLYGTVPFSLVILFDEYRNEEPYLILAFLALAAGAWLYLRNDHPWKKFLSLFGGMTLSMIITMLGQALLYDISFPATSFPSWTMTMSTVIYWIWLTLFMLLSLVLTWFPRMDTRAHAV